MIEAPEAFKEYAQFILWQPVPMANGKVNKQPIHTATLKPHDPHDPSGWMDYNTATTMLAVLGPGYGIGFVFTDKDPFFFFDIDGALSNGQWSQLAQEMCHYFSGCAVEVSYSGTGLHIFGSGMMLPHGCKNIPLNLELYTEKRFVALTGTGLVGDASFVPPPETRNWLVNNYFPPSAPVEAADWTNGPCLEWVGPVDDIELITKMLQSQSTASAFGGRASVAQLWAADPILASVYPTTTGTYEFDHSSADAALCAHLAFWTGKDCERMDRIFRMSGLVRDKWTEREYYRQRTILGAVSRCTDVYGANRQQQPTPATQVEGMTVAPAGDDRYKTGFQLLTVDQQVKLFDGCVYVRDLHKIFTKDGALLKTEQFNATYGGHVFVLDTGNTKTTRKAWEVFTESQAFNFPKAFGACFRPELPSGKIITEEGGTLVNTYVPAVIERKAGDATPFLEHLAKLLPDKLDRTILLSYMAACVQHVGVKFQWCPLLQGMEGNGKTLLATCLAKAIGWKYTHTPNANDLANKFNSWILGKLLIVVEEIYVNERKEAIETLKPLITNPIIEIQGKGTNQATGDNRANFFMCTNHKDAIRKTKTDRRYCVFYTAQQAPKDMRSSGMNGNYFPKLYDWLRKEGYAIVANYLMTYPIPNEHNPATECQRAPNTTSTSEVLRLSLGGLEQEVMEAIDEGRYGFANGWISSLAFNWLIKERKDDKRIPPNKRRQIILEMGFIPHPGLAGGRANNIIPKENGKPILFCREDHRSIELVGAAVTNTYKADQEIVT